MTQKPIPIVASSYSFIPITKERFYSLQVMKSNPLNNEELAMNAVLELIHVLPDIKEELERLWQLEADTMMEARKKKEV